MKRNIISASFKNTHTIEVVYFVDNINLSRLRFRVIDANKNKIYLTSKSKLDKNVATILLTSEKAMQLGNDYLLVDSEGEETYLDYDDYFDTDEFINSYSYDKDDLGAKYTKHSTKFKVYAPTANKVTLKLEGKTDGDYSLIPMIREENGVFSVTVKGDLFSKKYAYVVKTNGVNRRARDPYGVGTSLNSEYSAVIDLNEVKKLGTVNPENPISGNKDRVIYEVDIRDFTAKDGEKPTYSQFIEKIPYLSFIGTSYVQLLPVLDFDNVDDLTLDTYNWGYDPLSFFSLEGSYSKYPEDPLSRLIEFKNLVNNLHKAGIRVVMDVVYNHVFEHRTSDFEKIVPGYYFRKFNGRTCNGSGCGNDFASERFMGSKIIIDSLKYLTKTFDVDGFRFDLMGLIDLKTSKKIVKELQEIKPDILLYGEGWNMCTNLKDDNKTSSDNASKIPGMGFFNAWFRDLIKGPTFDQKVPGYVSGELKDKGHVENVLLGSYLCENYIDTTQTINYVECHDNQTLFDKLSAIHDDQNDILERVKLANTLTILSLGIPLIHMGQEIGLSKFGLDNTYNIKDVNDMDWKLVKKRYPMVKYLGDLITLRKQNEIFNLKDHDEIADTFELYQHENGLLTIKIVNEKYLNGNKSIIAIINPTDKNVTINLDDYYYLYFSTSGFAEQEIYVKSLLVSKSSIRILVKK